MATAKKLPSGNWRCRIYDKESGRCYSFTSELEGRAGKAEAELMAQEFLLGKRAAVKNNKTVGQCVEEYRQGLSMTDEPVELSELDELALVEE